MATYNELWSLGVNDDLRERVAVALVIEAQTLLAGTPTTAEAAYCAKVISNPLGEAKSAVYAVLAANSNATVAQITGASDAAIQTNVSSIFSALTLANGA